MIVLIIEIKPEEFKKAHELAKAIYDKEQKIGAKDKYPFIGGYKDNLSSDYSGFLGEICFARAYGLPEPKLVSSKSDAYDFKVNEIRIDIKTKLESSKHHWLNVPQYEKKHNKIDVFVFCEIYGKYFRVVGWEVYDKIPKISRVHYFANGSKGFNVNPRKLRNINELTGEKVEDN